MATHSTMRNFPIKSNNEIFCCVWIIVECVGVEIYQQRNKLFKSSVFISVFITDVIGIGLINIITCDAVDFECIVEIMTLSKA